MSEVYEIVKTTEKRWDLDYKIIENGIVEFYVEGSTRGSTYKYHENSKSGKITFMVKRSGLLRKRHHIHKNIEDKKELFGIVNESMLGRYWAYFNTNGDEIGFSKKIPQKREWSIHDTSGTEIGSIRFHDAFVVWLLPRMMMKATLEVDQTDLDKVVFYLTTAVSLLSRYLYPPGAGA